MKQFYLHLQRRLRPGVGLGGSQLGAGAYNLEVWFALVGVGYSADLYLRVGMGRTQDALAISCCWLRLVHQHSSLESERIFSLLCCCLLNPDPLLANPDVPGSSVRRLDQPLWLLSLLYLSSVTDGLCMVLFLPLFGVIIVFDSVLPVVYPLDQLEAGVRLVVVALSGRHALVDVIDALWVQSTDVCTVRRATRIEQLLHFDILWLDELLLHNLNLSSRIEEFLKFINY